MLEGLVVVVAARSIVEGWGHHIHIHIHRIHRIHRNHSWGCNRTSHSSHHGQAVGSHKHHQKNY